MGEYYKPVNVTRKEEVHPHRLNNGLKWGEWVEDYEGQPSATKLRVNELLASGRWSDSDEIAIVSDYGAYHRWADLERDESRDGADLYYASFRDVSLDL